MYKKIVSLLGILGFSVALTGCVSMRGPVVSAKQKAFHPQSRVQIVQKLQSITAWQADGAFSFDSAQQVGIANFRVDVSPYTWRVHIASGLNLVQMTIGNDALGVWYTDNKGHIQHAMSLTKIMQSQFGFSLPVNTLIDWMKGLSASDTAIKKLNQFNQLVELTENGWHLTYADYALYHSIALPGEIMITGHGEKIKMVIKKWHIGKDEKIHKKSK